MLAVASLLDFGETAVGIYVAGARAVPQLADGVKNSRGIDLLVRTLLEVTPVTAGAIGLIGRERPRDCLTVAGVAAQTSDAAAVIAGIASTGVSV